MKKECLKCKNKKGFWELGDGRLKCKNCKQKFAIKKKGIRIEKETLKRIIRIRS